MKKNVIRLGAFLLMSASLACFGKASPSNNLDSKPNIDPFWENAVVYFMMTDRFHNGDSENDHQFDRKKDGAVLRNFMGGDIKGITAKIREGYFNKLGVNVIWTTPLVEQIHGYWDEEWGRSYPFHGYWPKDWTRVDPNFGTEAEMREMIETAHAHGIKVLADVIVNHTGPKTEIDIAWPDDWIRTKPMCQWHNYLNNVKCALSASLTDILTESETSVELPDFLKEKWRKEGRLEKELDELDSFFKRTGLTKAPKNYIIKWLTDWVREYGIDGFRVDTAKHVEAKVWRVLKQEASLALKEWKMNNPKRKMDEKSFFMIGEVYEFGVDGYRNAVKGSRLYDYGDQKIDFFDYGFDSLINMGFATHAEGTMEDIFNLYSKELNSGPLDGVGIMNYIVSHDDPAPYDKTRSNPFMAALKLMLAPGAVQIYYGDELARDLTIEGAYGDATLRSFMNWQDLKQESTKALLQHWQKLGVFRSKHVSVGAGKHYMHNESPYIFSRILDRKEVSDRTLIAVGLNKGNKSINMYQVFPEGAVLKDYYSGQLVKIKQGEVNLDSEYDIVLLGKADN